MEKRFCKIYPNNDRLEVSFLTDLSGLPAIAKDITPDRQPHEEMKRDEEYFKDKLYSEKVLKELKQKGFSEDV